MNKENLLALRNAIDAALEDGSTKSLPITSGRKTPKERLVDKHTVNFAGGTWSKPNSLRKTKIKTT